MTRRSVYEPELMDRIEDLALQGLNSARIQAILSGEFGESEEVIKWSLLQNPRVCQGKGSERQNYTSWRVTA
jgi:hypothetical protein